jgi:general secretion pathway protein L
MTLQQTLNTEMDLASLVALARRGFAWWSEELAGMIPPRWRARLFGGSTLLAEQTAGGRWRVWRNGRPTGEGLTRSEARRSVGVLMPADAVLVRELEVPRMPRGDTRRMIALDIDRLSPLNPDLIYFDVEVIDPGGPGSLQKVLLGLAPRAAATEAVEAARLAGLRPARLSISLEDRGRTPSFDFLPQVLAAAGERPTRSRRAWLWGAVASLMALNLAVLVARDIASVADLQRQVEAQRPAASAAMRVRAAVTAEEARRRDLLARRAGGDPLAMLNAVTQSMPAGAWVQHLEWNGRSVRLVGFKPGGLDIGAAVRGSGVFANPRTAAAGPTAGNATGQPFDVTADARPHS